MVVKIDLNGKKTYLIAGAVAGVTMLYSLGYIDQHAYLALLGVLNSGGLATMRHGVEKSGLLPPKE